jgi:hypothetical protein
MVDYNLYNLIKQIKNWAPEDLITGDQNYFFTQNQTPVKPALTTTSEQWPPVYNGQHNPQLFKY